MSAFPSPQPLSASADDIAALCAHFLPASNAELHRAFDGYHELFANCSAAEQLQIDRQLGSLLADAGERMEDVR